MCVAINLADPVHIDQNTSKFANVFCEVLLYIDTLTYDGFLLLKVLLGILFEVNKGKDIT